MKRITRIKRIARVLFLVLRVTSPLVAQQVAVDITVNTEQSKAPISPLVYGINAYVFDSEWGNGDWQTGLDNQDSGLNVGSRRLGGNSMTSYNWENGYSNSGADDNNSNNIYQSYITGNREAPYAPGAALTTFHDHSLTLGAYSLLQLPAAGFVAADNAGIVTEAEAAPSARWGEVVFNKPGSPGSLSLVPNLGDGKVYVDEEMNLLINRYGRASSPTGIKGYELDNEPGLWHHYNDPNNATKGSNGTHPLLHPALTTCGELISRNIALASTVKRMDPNAETFGPAMWGYPEFYSLWSIYDNGTTYAPADWATYNVEPYKTNNSGDPYRYNNMTWVNAYLAKMKQASDAAGKRLLDVFSVHYYPASSAIATDALRMQAPRSLADPTFTETSWITQTGNGFTDGRGLNLIPTLKRSIDDFYPGTKLAITEYSFEGRHNISGAIAQCDALGTFGREGVYLANYFFPVRDYITAAFRIYRNYDGQNSTFGDTTVACTISDNAAGSSFASVDREGRLHLVVTNKNATQSMGASIAIASATQWGKGSIWGLGPNSTVITKLGDITAANNMISYRVPPLTICHFVLDPMSASGVTGDDATTREGDLSITVAPNPIASSGTLHFTLQAPSEVTLTLVDGLGRTARTLLHDEREPGSYNTNIDVADLPSGAYRLQFRAGKTTITKQVMVLR